MQFDGLPLAVLRPDPANMQPVLEDAYILIHEKKISSLRDLIPLLEKVARLSKPLVIVAGTSKAKRPRLVVNQLRGVLNVAAVKTHRLAIAARPCSATSPSSGSQLISEDLGIQLERHD